MSVQQTALASASIYRDAARTHFSREKTEELWRRLAAGDLAAIEQENWQSEYGDAL